MFRIKPIRNQTTAKYTYHNQNSVTQATNVIQSKITTIKKPTIEIVNPQKVTQLSKLPIKPLINNQVPKVSFVRSQKPQEKTLLKRNVNIIQHKLKIPQQNHTHLKKIQTNKNSQVQIGHKKQQVTQKHVHKKLQDEKNNIKQENKVQKIEQNQVPFAKLSEQKKIIQKIQTFFQKPKIEEKPSKPFINEEKKHEQVKKQQQNISKTKIQQKEERKQQKVNEQQKTKERQKQMQDLVLKIQRRREAREKQKLRIRQIEQKRKQNQQRALEFMNQRNGHSQNNQEVAGMLQLNDQLMHFSLAESIMDLQIKKLLKTNFNDFPNASQIKYQIQELQRINMSYEMVGMDQSNPLRNGLKNYRIEIFNRIGEEIMRAQAQGYSNPNFHIMEHDGRMVQPQNGNIPQAIRGLPKENQDQFIKYVQNHQEQECTICLGDIEKLQTVAKLQCGHAFHTNCIKQWVQSSANCPTCRFNIKFGPKKV